MTPRELTQPPSSLEQQRLQLVEYIAATLQLAKVCDTMERLLPAFSPNSFKHSIFPDRNHYNFVISQSRSEVREAQATINERLRYIGGLPCLVPVGESDEAAPHTFYGWQQGDNGQLLWRMLNADNENNDMPLDSDVALKSLRTAAQ